MAIDLEQHPAQGHLRLAPQAFDSLPIPRTESDQKRKCRSTVSKENLSQYMKVALSSALGADVDADEVIKDILSAVNTLDASTKGLKWQSVPGSLNGIEIIVDMEYISGKAEEEVWAVAVDTIKRGRK